MLSTNNFVFIHTTITEQEKRGTKKKDCSTQAEFLYNCLFVLSILTAYSGTEHRLALRESSNKQYAF